MASDHEHTVVTALTALDARIGALPAGPDKTDLDARIGALVTALAASGYDLRLPARVA